MGTIGFERVKKASLWWHVKMDNIILISGINLMTAKVIITTIHITECRVMRNVFVLYTLS